MDGFRFFQIYHALRLHFTSSYDVFKYRGKIASRSRSAFEIRKDAHVFGTWARAIQNDKDAGNICIANFIYNSEYWIYEADKQLAKDIYLKWLGDKEALSKVFTDDCNTLKKYIKDGKASKFSEFVFKTPKGNFPPLLQLYLSHNVIADTMVILDTIGEPFLIRWLKEYDNDPLIKSKVFTLIKYRAFCRYDVDKLITIFKEVLES